MRLFLKRFACLGDFGLFCMGLLRIHSLQGFTREFACLDRKGGQTYATQPEREEKRGEDPISSLGEERTRRFTSRVR